MKKNDAVPSGLILFRKLPGLTSFDALRDIKRALGTGKVGHTGTLDKFAEGLLLILTGRALKLSRWFTHCDKQYKGVICFGAETETLDPEGAVIAQAPLPSRESVEGMLSQFRGNIEQAPPAYSAIHIDGKRASALARSGAAVEMQKRPVTIYRLELVSWDPPFAKIDVHCSGGTYIRSLARDIALAAGSRGHLVSLLRTKVGGFELTKEQRTEKNEEREMRNGELEIRNIDKDVFDKLGISWVDISRQDAARVAQGKSLIQTSFGEELTLREKKTATALFCEDRLIAVIERQNNQWHYGCVYAGN